MLLNSRECNPFSYQHFLLILVFLAAQMLGISDTLPAFLDYKNLTQSELLRGVSFASAGSGFDIKTEESQQVITFPLQISLLNGYKLKLSTVVGDSKAEETINNSLVIISSGTSDFVQNYYSNTTLSTQLTVEKYAEFLVSQLSKYIEEIHTIGAKNFVLTELGTIGCLPIIRTRFGNGFCHDPINNAALYFNSQLANAAAELTKKLDINITINHAYNVMYYAVASPGKFGFLQVEKGCCGNGTVDYGETCKGKELCEDPKSYLFFDALHPSEKMYSYITDRLKVDLGMNVMG